MKKKTMIAGIETRFKKINAISKKVTRDFTMEDIHDFRVEIKKLRAFLRLMSMELKDSLEIKIPSRLLQFYTITGIIRGLQLQEQHIDKAVHEKNSALPETYLALIKMEAMAHMARAKELAKNKKFFETQERNVSNSTPAKAGKVAIKTFILFVWHSIRDILISNYPTDDALHSIRKLLKDLSYTWPYIKKEVGRVVPLLISDKESITTMTDLLGEFQDSCVSLDLLEAYDIKQITNAEERSLLLGLQNDWREEKDNKKRVVYSELIKLRLAAG